MSYSDRLTISQAQRNQPWTVPYSDGVQAAAVPHILGSHCALHAIKSIGKIAAVYEARDHRNGSSAADGPEREAIRAAAADLLTAALRFANLEGFDLAGALVERVREKNGGSAMPFGLVDSFDANAEALIEHTRRPKCECGAGCVRCDR